MVKIKKAAKKIAKPVEVVEDVALPPKKRSSDDPLPEKVT